MILKVQTITRECWAKQKVSMISKKYFKVCLIDKTKNNGAMIQDLSLVWALDWLSQPKNLSLNKTGSPRSTQREIVVHGGLSSCYMTLKQWKRKKLCTVIMTINWKGGEEGKRVFNNATIINIVLILNIYLFFFFVNCKGIESKWTWIKLIGSNRNHINLYLNKFHCIHHCCGFIFRTGKSSTPNKNLTPCIQNITRIRRE